MGQQWFSAVRALVAVLALVATLLPPVAARAERGRSFKAKCVEGETHRYDGGNGKSMLGATGDFDYGWSTEKWGGLDVSWTGGGEIAVGELKAKVVANSDGIIAAFWSNDLPSINLYSLVLDTILGEAVFTQSHGTQSGENRAIKVRSQNLKCSISWLK